ncbi:hypothetical protein ASG47_01930 [Devosia sp. Leaf420]|uniref:BA14K family protein n=1 Tax=Devosia sp. Leaf420 TaxID=1736374 RepID=UPI00071619BF|nr:BA14K family protein [Devosia sp. Leaf420]KQT51669.1 hypothetical protein ASG47_01930 [Devosia sp. Leaf420]
MMNLARIVSGVALGGMAMLSAAAPTQAQSVNLSFGQRYQVVETYCDRNPWDRDCRGFYNGGWDDRDYYNFYNTRRSSIDNISAGIFGIAFGAALGSIIANGAANNNRGDVVVYREGNGGGNVNACYARYKSYDERTNTYLGYDGIRHQCRL